MPAMNLLWKRYTCSTDLWLYHF